METAMPRARKAPKASPGNPKPAAAIAFALGGLGGNNAHGAGVLQAALDRHVEPAIISCTSGQIYWTYLYLIARDQGGQSVDAAFRAFVAGIENFRSRDLDLMKLAAFGMPGIMRPAFPEIFIDAMENLRNSVDHLLTPSGHTFIAKEILGQIPLRVLAPDFAPGLFGDMAALFNRSPTGIVFNSFDPVEGEEVVHMNPAALRLMGRQPGTPSSHRARTRYADIKPDDVRDGLWLYQYGFADNTRLDGCYYRQIILSEVTCARRVYVARPVNYRWLGKLPTNWMECEDMKTKVGFNGSYEGERDKLMLINKLLGDGLLNANYHKVELQEIEIEVERGYFDYIFEDMDVFATARERAAAAF
jgi:hypothetical protein